MIYNFYLQCRYRLWLQKEALPFGMGPLLGKALVFSTGQSEGPINKLTIQNYWVKVKHQWKKKDSWPKKNPPLLAGLPGYDKVCDSYPWEVSELKN